MISSKKNNARILLVVFVLCFFIQNTHSQTVYSNNAASTFSFTLGMTATGLFRDTISYEEGILANGGFAYTHKLNSKSNIGVELLYSGKAVKQSSPIIKYRFGYVDVPVYYQHKFSDNFMLNVGAQYSKYTVAKYYFLDGAHQTGVHPENLNTKMDDDIGLLLGVELGLSKNVFLCGRYTISTKPILDSYSPYFGVFQLSFKVVVIRNYKQTVVSDK